MNSNSIKKNKDLDIANRSFELFFALSLVIIAGFRPIGIDRDSVGYVKFLNWYFENNKIDILFFEPSFWIIANISKIFFNSSVRVVFIIYAILGVSVNVLAIRRLAKNVWLSYILYFCLYFVLHEMTQIRTGVACGLFLYAIPDLKNKKAIKYFLKILLAVSFHYSAIIAIPIYFISVTNINKRRYILLPLVGIALSFVLNIDFIAIVATYFKKGLIYINEAKINNAIGKSIFLNFSIASMLIVYYVILYIKKQYGKIELAVIKIMGFMFLVYYSFSAVQVFSVRFSEFIGIVSIIFLPQLIPILKEKNIVVGAICLYGIIVLLNLTIRQGLISL